MSTMSAMGGYRRVVRVLLAGLGAMLAAAVAQPAGAASGTLTLSALHGQASATFTMTFTYSPAQICPTGTTVTFTWDSPTHTLATVGLSGASCTATSPAVLPPAGVNGVGPHTITARTSSVTAPSVTYTIDPPPPPPTPTPTPTPRPTPTPSPSPTPTPTPDLPPPP